MAFNMGDLLPNLAPGYNSGWDAGNAQAQEHVTNLSPHVDGGTATGTTGTNAGSDTTILHWAAGIVIASGLLLWLMGGVIFRSIRL